jgi:S1-C subfamily serine protease
MGKGPNMYKTTSTFTPLYRPNWLRRMVLVIGLVCLSFISMAGSVRTTYADGIPGGNVADPVVRAVDIARPAVVRIITSLGGHLTVHFSTTQGTQDVTFPQNDPKGYLLRLSGSGTFITAHGDILTADHMINPPRDQSLSDFLDELAGPDVTNYINQHSTSQPTQGQVVQALKSGALPSLPNYDQPSSEVFLSTDYTGPLTAPDLLSVPANVHATVDRIEQQSTFQQKDVAIIHVNMNDMASVQLGDSSTVQPQDELTIIGFPGNGDVSNKPTDLLTSSVNRITVSSIKTTDSGAPVIQVGGNVEHGDSGGPALDSQGNVVGIVSFGANGPGSTSFLQASNSARELVQSLKLDITPGAFEKAWSQAFKDYAASTPGHWHKAQQEFTQIANNYPAFKAITPYLNYAQGQATNESTTQSPTTASSGTTALFWTIGVVGVLLLGLLLFAVAFRQRRKPARTIAHLPSSSPRTWLPRLGDDEGRRQTPLPTTVAQQGQNGFVVPKPRVPVPLDDNDGLTAFGAPPRTPQPVPPVSPTLPVGLAATSGILISWPCGHMNRPNARYCSVCGEPRRVEQ